MTLSLFLTVLLVFCTVCTPPALAAEEEYAPDRGITINVYNWGEYISNGEDDSLDVNEEFYRRTGIRVNYTTYPTNEELYSKLKGGGASYDVIIPSDYMIAKLIDEEMILPLNFENIPNFELINDQFKNPEYDPENKYSVPYTWGTVGIFYNKTMVDEDESEITWDILWSEKYAGQILMFDNPRDAFGIAQRKLGLSFNSTDPAEWYAAAEELSKQKPLVQAYVMDQIFTKMGNGEAALAPYYAGDAVILLDENEDIGFVIPESGTNKFVDAMCIPVGSSHPREAEEYINFLCDTEIAAANIDYIGYSTPQREVFEQLDPEIAENPIFYPSDELMERSEFYVNLPTDISTLLDDLWVQVKTGGTDSTLVLILVLAGFLLLYIGIVIYKKAKAKRELS